MKKIIIIILMVLLIPFKSVYAETVYSEWSTTPSGYPNEEEAIQYGVILPKTWSEPNIFPATDEVDIFFQKEIDCGNYSYVQSSNGEKDFRINSAKAQVLLSIDFGEPKKITNFYVDVDCSDRGGGDNYYAPGLHIVVDGTEVAKAGQAKCMGGLENWGGTLNIIGQVLILKMDDCSENGRFSTHIRYSYIETELLKYSHVIEWYEPTNWRFDTPYELLGGENSQKPAERKVYRHPINPEIYVEKRYLYEGDTIDDIQELAKAIDYTGDDITEKIVITKIVYDDDGVVVNYPDSFDSYKSDTIHVTYYVVNDLGIKAIKTVKLYILRNGMKIDFNIYDRYIEKDYLYTLEDNSIWKNNDYENKLNEALEWLERK